MKLIISLNALYAREGGGSHVAEQTIKECIMFNAQFTVQNAMWTMHD